MGAEDPAQVLTLAGQAPYQVRRLQQPSAYFCKSGFVRAQTYLFIHAAPVATFLLHWGKAISHQLVNPLDLCPGLGGGGWPIIRLSVFKTQKMAWGRSYKAVLLSWPSVHLGLSVWWPLWPSLNCSLFHLPKKKKTKNKTSLLTW